MKFDDLYPAANPGIAVSANLVMTLHEEQEMPCFVCGDSTSWFHREFIIHLCSEACLQTYLSLN